MTHRNFIFLTGCLLAAPFAVHAAEEKAAPASVRCRVLAVGKAPVGAVYVKNGGQYRPVAISTDYVTASFRADAKEGIVFYRKIDVPAPKPGEKKEKDRYEPFAKCAPDGGITRQLVFITPGGNGGWIAMAKSDVESAFPPGTRLVFNLSSQAVELDFGGTKLLIKPKQSGLLKQAQKATDGLAHIQMRRQSNTGAWVPFLSSVWRQGADERNILLIYPAAGSTEEVSVSSIQDMVEPKDDEERKAEVKAK